MTDKLVYVLLDQRTVGGPYKYGNFTFQYEPFYVGKGDPSRPSQHARLALKFPDRVNFKNNKIRSIFAETGERPKIFIVQRELSDEGSKVLERELINTVGTYLDDQPGPLTNVVKDPDHIPPPPKGDKHYTRVNPELAKQVHQKRLKAVGYDFLSRNKDGISRASLKVKAGTHHFLTDQNPSTINSKAEKPYLVCAWLRHYATPSSKLGWFLKDEIEDLQKKNPELGYKKFAKLVNKQLNLLEIYGMELDENLPMKIAKYKKWTPKKLQYWQEWKSSYKPV